MVKIEFLIFGYRRITTQPENLNLLSSILLRAGISSVITADGVILSRESDISKIQALLSGRIDFSISKPLGLYGGWKRYDHKAAFLISLVVTACVVVLLSQIVWDIRVEGNSGITDGEIVISLENLGFSVGDFWGAIDRGKLESALLDSEKRISWVNINRRGCVAYVKVIEADDTPDTQETDSYGYSNIVSNRDCIIEEITVKRGIANVKAGDAVKKGDLLVIGVMPEEVGGGLCDAEADVIGRLNDTVSVKIGREEEKISYSERKIYSITLKIFKFSLNIFKLYGNLTSEYDIIENEIAYSIFGRHKLPLSIKTVYCVKKESTIVTLSDDEMTVMAAERLSRTLASSLIDADLLKLRTRGEFREDGYYLYSDIVYLSEVGEKIEITQD